MTRVSLAKEAPPRGCREGKHAVAVNLIITESRSMAKSIIIGSDAYLFNRTAVVVLL